MRRALAPAVLLSALCAPALATNLDIATEYRMRVVNYRNLTQSSDQDSRNDQGFVSQNARVGFTFKDIPLGEYGGETQTLDIVLGLRALGSSSFIAGSTVPAPFDRIAAHYPDTGMTPFMENAYLRAHNLAGWPWTFAFGRQNYSLGSGLLLDDDGVGLNGVSMRAELPWGGVRTSAFVFQAQKRPMGLSPGLLEASDLTLYGLSMELPTEGVWQLNQLVERDRATQLVAANSTDCDDLIGIAPAAGPCVVSRATRWFSSLHYKIASGPIVFEGEAALQKGAATPTGLNPSGNHVTFNGNAQILKAKWKQTFYSSKESGRLIRGLARVSLARGSGDKHDTQTTDEAFFPSMGHRFDGLERAGFGEFFGATPYDAFGGQSTSTVNGLPNGASGIVAVSMGVTPPAVRGIALDIDYYLFQADRNVGSARTLGTEWDFRLRYDVAQLLQLRASAAFFSAGPALNPNKGKARRYMFEASGRF
ncbi:MAG: hypothetical protein WC728_11000 [Elusimicrobiota bacterium]